MIKEKKVKKRDVNIVEIDIDNIKPNEWNPNIEDADTFNALCEQIGESGMLEPIVVCPDLKKEGKYVIISGEHRYEACRVLGYAKVPCIIVEDWDEDMQKFQTVRFNVLRGKIDPSKFVKLYKEMLPKYGKAVLQDMMKFADRKAFEKLVGDVQKVVPVEIRKRLEKTKEEMKTVDDLANILNEMFTKYGNTLDRGYMVFSWGGKEHIFIKIHDRKMKRKLEYAKEVADVEKRMLSEVFYDMITGKLIPQH